MYKSDDQKTITQDLGLIINPFRHWQNDDLLFNKNQQEFFKRQYPKLAPVFDWPELRELFKPHDDNANAARKRSRRSGVGAAMIGLASLLVAAVTPLVSQFASANGWLGFPVWPMLGLVAAVLAVVSMTMGYSQILRGEQKQHWLISRFWTERIRQFHFQLMINNLPFIVEVAHGARPIEDWLDFRKKQLDCFQNEYMTPVPGKLDELTEDQAADRPWLSRDWVHPGEPPEDSPELAELLTLIHQRRAGIQMFYCRSKLRAGLYSPASRARWVRFVSDHLTIALLVVAFLTGVVYIFGYDEKSITVLAIRSVAGVIGACIIALRVLNEGLQLSNDAERYRWLLAALVSINSRFEHANLSGRINLLRETEQLAYHEMRRFFVAVRQARFIM